MDSISSRINDLINSLGLSKNQFSKNIGTSSALTSQITSGKDSFRIDYVQKIISTFPSLNAKWLLNGEGEMWQEDTQKTHTKTHTVEVSEKKANLKNSDFVPENLMVDGIFPSELIKSKIDSIDKLLRLKFPNYLETDKVYEEYKDLTSRIDNLLLSHRPLGSVFTHSYVEKKLKQGTSIELIVNELSEERNPFEEMIEVVKEICNDLEQYIQKLSKYDTNGVLNKSNLLSLEDLGELGKDTLKAFKKYEGRKEKSNTESNNQ